MTDPTPVWWRLSAWAKDGRSRKRVSFAVEARGPLGALRRVHDLGYILNFEDEHVTHISFERSFDADYRLPDGDCTGSTCALPAQPEVTGNLS